MDGSSQYYPPSVFPLRELPTGFPGRLAYIEAHAEGAAWRLVPKIVRTPWYLSGAQLRMIALELHDGIERGGAQLLWMLTPRSLAPSAQLTALRFAARRLSSPADPVAAISRAARRSSNRHTPGCACLINYFSGLM